MKILVTGGAGYLGSITATALEAAGHVPLILDSLVTGPRAFVGTRAFYEGDVADLDLLTRIVSEHPDLAATIHMAGRVIVPESVTRPELYHRENVVKTGQLAAHLSDLGKPDLVFSSSASVYAPGVGPVVDEDAPVGPQSPYAQTKADAEQALTDLATAGRIRAVLLRYFNPIGSDPGLQSGVHVREPSHVLGQLVRTAQGDQAAFTITGTDWPTRDGTGLRDYVHAWDLARAHVRAVERLADIAAPSATINLGTGSGVTVRELVTTFEQVVGRRIPVIEGPRRDGDTPGAYAAVDRAADLLGWRAELGVADGIASALAWGAKRRTVLGHD